MKTITQLIKALLAIAWTALLLYLMLTPGEGTTADDVSAFFGGTDLTDGIGHIGLFFGLAWLWYQYLRTWTTQANAVRMAIFIAIFIGIMTETAQLWIPNRGANLPDYLANCTGALSLLLYRRYFEPQLERYVIVHKLLSGSQQGVADTESAYESVN